MLSQLLSRHKDQFEAMSLPKHLHQSACEKIASQAFDAGSFFQFQEVETEFEDEDEADPEFEGLSDAVSCKYSLVASGDVNNEGMVLLIDHMWTTTFPQSRDHLKKIGGLCDRIASMIGLEENSDFEALGIEEFSDTITADVIQSNPDLRTSTEASNGETRSSAAMVDAVWRAVWPHLCCYLLPIDDYTRWFLMDEVGTSIGHSCRPNFKCSPLLVNIEGVPPFALSLLWPVCDIQTGDVITRDYLPNVPTEDPSRPLRLKAFHREGMRAPDGASVETAAGTEAEAEARTTDTAQSSTFASVPTPGPAPAPAPVPTSVPSLETPLEWSAAEENLSVIVKDKSKALKVYCDRPDHLNPSLMHPTQRIVLVSTPVQADVLYLIDHTISAPESKIKDAESEDQEHDKRGKITSQFCWNGMIVSKEHLVRTMNKAYGTVPFLPVTYDLSHSDQLKNFIADFSRREKDKSLQRQEQGQGVDGQGGDREGQTMDNIWIMKRYRGRQSMDYPISDSLSCALRHVESSPRLACKYVTRPALYKGRKFDLRFYVIVLSLQPLRIFRHEMFVIRAANTQYSASDLEEYQKHFTVMNFLDDNSNAEDDSVRAIRGTGGRENPTSVQFTANFNKEYAERKRIKVIQSSSQSSTESSSDIADSANSSSSSSSSSSSCPSSSSSSSSSGSSNDSSNSTEDEWGRVVQPAIDTVLRNVFEGVNTAFKDEPPHPSGRALHPNAAWSLNQPNVCTARAMYGVDVILSGDNEPLVLEVQWAPDCAQAVVQNKYFWNEILGGLYLEEFTKFRQI